MTKNIHIYEKYSSPRFNYWLNWACNKNGSIKISDIFIDQNILKTVYRWPKLIHYNFEIMVSWDL